MNVEKLQNKKVYLQEQEKYTTFYTRSLLNTIINKDIRKRYKIRYQTTLNTIANTILDTFCQEFSNPTTKQYNREIGGLIKASAQTHCDNLTLIMMYGEAGERIIDGKIIHCELAMYWLLRQ